MGETRVDLLHLLEDIRDAYAGPVEETIITEILANALDAGASHIAVTANPQEVSLSILDNGSGMQRRELNRYHDIAASSKSRGQGIGFAGVGIKLGLLVSESVLTETRRGRSHVATQWYLSSRYRAPWKWVSPPGLVSEQGTAVRLTLHNPLSPLLDPGFLESTIRRQFAALFDPTFDPLLEGHYRRGVTITINGQRMEKQRWAATELALLNIRMLRKRKPSAIGYLFREPHPIPEDQQGVGISTFGKVIKRGWDWLGLSPGTPERIGGLIEAPALSSSLTLNKGDFIRVGTRGATYLAYRKAIQEAVLRQLSVWGDARGGVEETPPRHMRPLERDLERVLEDLSDVFPLLGTLVEHRKGGQKRLPLGEPGSVEDVRAIVTSGLVPTTSDADGAELQITSGNAQNNGSDKEPEDEGRPPQSPPATPDHILLPERGGPRRPARFGLGIQFEDRPEDREIGRLVESTVWVNQAHPAYKRAVASRSIGYHIALAVGMALAPLAVEPAKEHGFLMAFLSRWGKAVDPQNKPKRRRK